MCIFVSMADAYIHTHGRTDGRTDGHGSLYTYTNVGTIYTSLFPPLKSKFYTIHIQRTVKNETYI